MKVKDFELNTLFEPITDRRVSSHALRQSSFLANVEEIFTLCSMLQNIQP